MTATLAILEPGLQTTIQDLGRPGFQHLGVAVGGALDPLSFRAANILVGNAPDVGALEVAYIGPKIRVEADSARFACVGAHVSVEVFPDETARTGTAVGTLRSFTARRGDILRIGVLQDSAVVYVAVEGGFALQPVFGSVSTYIRGGMGGWHGRALVAGDQLPLHRQAASERGEYELSDLDLSLPPRFRVIVGPQSDYFSEAGLRQLFSAQYTVRPDSNRMGMRLSGPKLEHAPGFNIISDAIAPGSIQVPGDGQPIILMADRQTTGGYPKIATVISADIPALGRVRLGSSIAFEEVTLEEASRLRRLFLEEIDSIPRRLTPYTPGDMTSRLFGANLISGVVDASLSA